MTPSIGAGWEELDHGVLDLVPGHAGSGLAPLVLIAPLIGDQAVIDARHLAAHLDDERRVLMLELQGRTGEDRPIDTVVGLAAHYLERLREVVPSGPVVLGGHSLGGAIALEMARRLDDRRVEAVVMFDTRIADDDRLRWSTTAKRPLRRARGVVRWKRGVPTDVGAELKASTRQAWWTYRPRPWTGRVVYLAARGTDETPEDHRRDERWLRVLPAMEVHETPGGHSGAGSLLDEPHVAATAALLLDALATGDLRPGSDPLPGSG